MATQSAETRNLKLIAHVNLKRHNNIGRAWTCTRPPTGDASSTRPHESAPKDFTSVDVTDLANPRRSPTTSPQIPEGADANGINDVHVDENGIMCVVDRLQGGLYILEINI